MSMCSSPLVDTGFYINAEVAAYILLPVDRESGSVPSEIKKLLEDGSFAAMAKAGTLPCEYSDISMAQECIEDLTSYCSGGFDGEIDTLFPERTATPIEENLGDDDYLLYIPAAREADLFKAAYSGPEELLEEFKNVLTAASIILPDDFDWWAHIATIKGTIFA